MVQTVRIEAEARGELSPQEAIPGLDKAVKNGVIKRGTADRKKSRLTLALNRATAAAK